MPNAASIAFFVIPQLNRLPGEDALQALMALHGVLQSSRQTTLARARVLSTMTGALIVVPDHTNLFIHQHLDGIARTCEEKGIAIRVGVTHGDVQVLADVDDTENYIGGGINIAARLATSPQNTGCAFHESYISFARAAVTLGAKLRPARYPIVEIRGKLHDVLAFPCALAPAEVFPVLPSVLVERLPEIVGDVENINAAVLAYDLPRFSAGDANQLKLRFRAVVDAMKDAKVTQTAGRTYFSPGGDGGIIVVQHDERSGKSEAHEAAERLLEQFEAESQGREAEIRVECRIGLHYGPVQLYLNAEGVKRPTGVTCFIADAVAGDEEARGRGVVVTDAFSGIIGGGSTRLLNQRYEALLSIGEDGNPARGIVRYVRRMEPVPYVASTHPPQPATPTTKGPIFVVIVAGDGTDALAQLMTHLALAVRKELLSLWHAGMIQVGDDRQKVTSDHVQAAAAILLLVTPQLLVGEPYEWVEKAMARCKQGARVIPIMVDPVDLDLTPFKGLAALPRDAVDQDKVVRSISSRRKPDQDKVWAEIAGALSAIAKTLPKPKAA